MADLRTELRTDCRTDLRRNWNVMLLGAVSLLNDISSEIIQPILPLFITALGGGSLAVGLIGGISDGLPSIIQVFAGYWSDRTGRRKPLVVAGYSLSALGKMLLPISSAWQQVFLLKTAERCGKGLRSAPRDALICESVEVSRRGKGFGLHRAMDSTGAVIGSILAFALWKGGMDYRSILLVAGVISVAAIIPLFRVKEGPSPGPASGQMELKASDLSPELRRFIAIASLFAMGNFSYMFFLLRAGQLFTGAEAIAMPLMLYILFNLVYAGLALPAGSWSDKIGRKKVLTLGYALFALTALGFAYVSSLAGLIVLFALHGLVYAMVDASQRAFISDLSDAHLRSTSLGIYYGAVGISAIVSGLAAGWLWAQLGAQAAFLFGAAAAGLAALALAQMRETKARS